MLKKNAITLLVLVLSASISFAQSKFYTKTGKISFYSKAPLEEIEGKNKTVTAVLDSKSGALQFAVQMKGFEFEKQLMQQHFNENYVESDKYPKAEFKGTVTNNSEINYSKDGSYTAKVKGKLTRDWIVKWVTNPKSFNDHARMPSSFFQSNVAGTSAFCEGHGIPWGQTGRSVQQ